MSLGSWDMTVLLDHVHMFSSFLPESSQWVMQCCLRAQKTTGIQQRSLALSLSHRDVSSFFESFDDVMHCRWWDLQILCNLTLRNIVFIVFHKLIFMHSIYEPLPIFSSERLCISKTYLLYLIMAQTWCQLTELVARCSTSWILYFSPLLPPCQLFFCTFSRHFILFKFKKRPNISGIWVVHNYILVTQ